MPGARGVTRNVRNILHNYSESQKKVREATSNEPWGPSTTMMGEIADLTYNHIACSDMMQIIWKRLNDGGKNWRHAYKSLVLLDYLVKLGHDRIAQQCRENIFAIQSLKDFQYQAENGKDLGMNVREKAKTLVALLKDDERLQMERQKSLQARNRFKRIAVGIDQTGQVHRPDHSAYSNVRGTTPKVPTETTLPTNSITEATLVQPTNEIEEALQLKLAIDLSLKEEEERAKTEKSESLKMKMAEINSMNQDHDTTNVTLKNNNNDFHENAFIPVLPKPNSNGVSKQNSSGTNIDKLLDLGTNSQEPANVMDDLHHIFTASASNNNNNNIKNNNQLSSNNLHELNYDQVTSSSSVDPWRTDNNSNTTNNGFNAMSEPNPIDVFFPVRQSLKDENEAKQSIQNLVSFDLLTGQGKEDSHNFLGETEKKLVDFDNLVSSNGSKSDALNNPFQISKGPTLDDLANTRNRGFVDTAKDMAVSTGNSNTSNPFL
ncbi:hypothetical protein SNEBB_005895 [Seison nebaliae]|nr:hypothetical protein SNEBB_005895 [Seison nebaliae]